VGTGNIAGVAGALAIGGPGAVFWMWCSAFLGMCTKFAEVTLAIHFREKNVNGEYIGGPMYYIKNGLGPKWQWLAALYALFGTLAVFGTGNATQVNTIVSSIDSALMSYNLVGDGQTGTLNLILGIVIALMVATVLLGGIKRIGKVTEKLVPFMAVLYVILALGVIILNIKSVPAVFAMIFEGAFSPKAVTGGLVGSMFVSLKKGVSRGIFSNEAGLGTGSIAHACSDTDDAVGQGYFGIFEVFMDTIVICTMTALVILCSGVTVNYGAAAGAELTISGFTSTYGSWVSIFTACAMCCFAFSTIIGWGLYGSRCVEFLFKSKAVRPFLVLYALVSIVGATIDLGLLWDIAETFNGLMAIPNLIALLLLSGVVVKLVKEHKDA
jgi:AGCS family alanine or glycine:cation symporter